MTFVLEHNTNRPLKQNQLYSFSLSDKITKLNIVSDKIIMPDFIISMNIRKPLVVKNVFPIIFLFLEFFCISTLQGIEKKLVFVEFVLVFLILLALKNFL